MEPSRADRPFSRDGAYLAGLVYPRRYCTGCTHRRTDPRRPQGNWCDAVVLTDPVDGTGYRPPCSAARAPGGPCGLGAELWEPRVGPDPEPDPEPHESVLLRADLVPALVLAGLGLLGVAGYVAFLVP